MKPDYSHLRALVLARSGIALGPDKDYLFDSRLAPLARAKGFADVNALVTRLRSGGSTDDALRTLAVESLATHETSFFRDVSPFDALRRSVIRSLVEPRPSTAPLWFWSAGCATGQEPYSLAMMVHEQLPDLLHRVKILATDFSTGALERARTGRFNQIEVNRGLPAAMLLKYFHREGTEWVISSAIRSVVEFRTVNLIEALPVLPLMDVVFLRNVLIYFDPETRLAALQRVVKNLARGGLLVLGATETLIGLDDALQLRRVVLDGGTFYRNTR